MSPSRERRVANTARATGCAHWQQADAHCTAMCSWERLGLTCDTGSDDSDSEFAQRHSHAAVCVGSAVWIYGGFHGGALSDQLLELWPRDWSWRRRYAPGPPATVLHTMVSCLDQVILFGGLVQSEASSMATNQLWLLDTTQCAWSLPATQGEPPSARVGHAAAVASSQPDGAALMYVYGGYAPGTAEYLNDFTVLSLHTWAWSQPHISVDHCTPPLCSSATLTALGGGALLLLGGSQHKQVTDAAMLLESDGEAGLVLSRLGLDPNPNPNPNPNSNPNP